MVVRGLILTIAASGVLLGQDWSGAEIVWQTDTTDKPHMANPLLVSDRNGTPWILWMRWYIPNPDSTMVQETSCWNGTHWTEPKRLPDTIKVRGSYWDAVFDDSGRLFLIYNINPLGNLWDVQSVRYNPSTGQWEPPVQVNDPDTISLDDGYPRIDVGGGNIWAVWNDSRDNSVIYNVKASKWDDTLHLWSSEITVNPDTGSINRIDWFPDVAVDRAGTPHVVWTHHTTDIPGVLLYSRYENNQWSPPETLSDSLIVYGPYGGTKPRLEDDSIGNLHCVFIGARPGDTVVGLYYCQYTPSGGWSEPVRTDTWAAAGQPIWDKALAVAGPDDIWVAYDRGGGSNWMIFAQHFDGQQWAPEVRIDDKITYRGGFPVLTLDRNCYPFVAWSADSSVTGHESQIWFNRYKEIGGIVEPLSFISSKPMTQLVACMVGVRLVEFRYETFTSGSIRLEVFDKLGRRVWSIYEEKLPSRYHTTKWNGICFNGCPAPAGVYFCRLITAEKEERCSFVLLSE